MQFLQIQLPTACWRNFFSTSKIQNFYCIINQFIRKISAFPDSPYDTTAGAIRTVTIREGQPTLRAICESDETYTVETYANPSRGSTVTGAATGLHYGDVVTVEAIPAPGYRFVEWADDDKALAIRTFAVTEDLALEAYFEEIPPEEE